MLCPDRHGQVIYLSLYQAKALRESPREHERLSNKAMIQRATGFTRRLLACYRAWCVALFIFWPTVVVAQSHSDLLIVIDQDGTGYTAQHTLFATGELIISHLPPGRETLLTAFSGAGSALFQRAHEQEPNKLSLMTGSVFTRFRHRFDADAKRSPPAKTIEPTVTVETTATKEATGTSESPEVTIPAEAPLLTATLDQFNTTMVNSESLVFRVSWVLPPNIELLKYRADESSRRNSASNWLLHGSVLTFEQRGGVPKQLLLEYRVHASADNRADACLASLGPSEWCSPDIDADSVPDYRDICIATDIDTAIKADTLLDVLADDGTVTQVQPTPNTSQANSLGCVDNTQIVLNDVQFESGQSYLNAKARSTLDKVAVALQRMPDSLFRIAAYTDNAGYFQNNQLLSENRANAVRHYLMLRGLGPNQIQARGYGESNPAHDNRTAAGRQANRRVELQLLNEP